MIVAREHADLLPVARARFASDPSVEIFLDRRQRTAGEAPAVERRQPPDYWEDIRFHPLVITVRRQRDGGEASADAALRDEALGEGEALRAGETPRDGGARRAGEALGDGGARHDADVTRSTTMRDEGTIDAWARERREDAGMEMERAQSHESGIAVDATPLRAWLEEGQRLVAAWREQSQREQERLRLRAEMAEQECEKLREEMRALLQDNEMLRRDAEQLRRTQGEIAHAFSRAVGEMTRLLEPLGALAHRLGQEATPRG
ncbi:MAG TPA: hypothetical protein VNN07_02685 [Candidatus Tectomicrobia bacterium]|nr:hypothetical protein [Candidatus Tectomicrobia bacterium]